MTDYQHSPCPKSSPWGAIQHKRELAPGIWTVSTAGHGGVKLSRERNAAVPAYMRAEGGWYEEDCQWSLAAIVHKEAFQRVVTIDGRPDKTEYEYALESFRGWYPDQYEQFFGVELKPGESFKRDEWRFNIDNHDKFVVSAAWGDWASWVPEGKVGVVARRSKDQSERWFLLDHDRYAKRGRFGHVIDPAHDTEITKPEAP